MSISCFCPFFASTIFEFLFVAKCKSSRYGNYINYGLGNINFIKRFLSIFFVHECERSFLKKKIDAVISETSRCVYAFIQDLCNQNPVISAVIYIFFFFLILEFLTFLRKFFKTPFPYFTENLKRHMPMNI